MRNIDLRRQRLACSGHQFRPSKPRWNQIIAENVLSEQYWG
jgi:hypothetical protein